MPDLLLAAESAQEQAAQLVDLSQGGSAVDLYEAAARLRDHACVAWFLALKVRADLEGGTSL